MIDGIGDGIFGSAGDGILDAMFGGARAAASAAGDMGAGEGMLSQVIRYFTTAADFAAQISWNAVGIKAAHDQFLHGSGFSMPKESIGHVEKGVMAHALMAQQLKKHFSEDEPARKDYLESGAALPSEDVLKLAHRKLRSKLYDPSANVVRDKAKDKFFDQVNKAHELLSAPEVREAYADAMSKNPEGVKALFDKLTDVKWEHVQEFDPERLLIEGPKAEAKPLTGMAKWASELTPAKRTGLIFGAVGATVIGGYVVAKIMENHRKQKETQSATHVQRMKQETQTAVGIA